MAQRGGWRRVGSSGRFRYLDARGNRITDEAKLARIAALAIPPAWRDVRISPSPRAKLQATGYDKAGRKQYLYHPDFRAAQEQAKFDKLVRFGEALPVIRAQLAADLDAEPLSRAWTSAVAVRLINLTWFRPGDDRYRTSYGVTTLRKSHVKITRNKISFGFRAKHGVRVRTVLIDDDLAQALRLLLAVPGGGRLFRFEEEGVRLNLTARRLNDYIQTAMGEDFSAKDFRTWGGTLLAAIALAERGPAESETEAKRTITASCRSVAELLGNTPAVCRASYISPAVIDQYLEGRTIETFRRRHLRIVGARDVGLEPEELALLTLLRSWRMRRAREAA
jgi:DNA topoisomerase-1